MSELKEVENELRELRAKKKELAAEKRANAEIRNELVAKRASARARIVEIRKQMRASLANMVEYLKLEGSVNVASSITDLAEELEVEEALFNEAREELADL